MFPTKNCFIKLHEAKIKMKESSGGHYTIQTSDLGKICGESEDYGQLCTSMAEKYYCKVCGNVFQTRGKLEDHTENKHVQVESIECKVCGQVFFDEDCFHFHLSQKCSSQGRKIKSALKSTKVPREALKKENNVDSILTELNTMVNGTSNEKERKLIQVVKNLTILNEELQVKCQLSEKQCEEKFNIKTHKPEHHGENSIQSECETCESQLNENQI